MEVEGCANLAQAISGLLHYAMLYNYFRPLFQNITYKATEILY